MKHAWVGFPGIALLGFLLSVSSAQASFPLPKIDQYKACPNPTPIVAKTRTYHPADIPADAPTKERHDYLVEMNNLDSPYWASFTDHLLSPHQENIPVAEVNFATKPCEREMADHTGPYPALRDIEGSQPAEEVVWVTGDLLPLPDASTKPIATVPQKLLMSATRTYGDGWLFVWYGETYGWTKQAVPLQPNENLVSSPASAHLRSYAEWEANRAMDRTIAQLETLRKANDPQLTQARAELCPHDFTPREIDGLVGSEETNNVWDRARRVKLQEVCDPTTVYDLKNGWATHPATPVKHVSLTVKTCPCIETFQDEATDKEVQAFPPGDNHAQCELLRAHVQCWQSESAENGGSYLACPLSCVQYEK